MSTRMILIRHGETDWNRERRYCGFSDVDLNSKGIEQARKLCGRLSREKIDKVYSSDSTRALNFARIIFKDSVIEAMPELREMNFGIFEGLTYEEIMKKPSNIYTKWLDNPFCITVPEGEGLCDFKKRVEKVFEDIVLVNKNKTLAIVTHAGPIRVVIGNILNMKDIWSIRPDLASISIVDYKNGKWVT